MLMISGYGRLFLPRKVTLHPRDLSALQWKDIWFKNFILFQEILQYTQEAKYLIIANP